MADPLEAACLLVGRFMYHFALVEQKVDKAVIKLLSLDEKCAPMVGLMAFAKKVEDLVRATSVLQATRTSSVGAIAESSAIATCFCCGRVQSFASCL